MAHERLRFPEPAPRRRRDLPAALRDPLRAFTLLAAAATAAGALLPWLHAWKSGVGWYDVSGFELAGDGGFAFELAVLALILTFSDRAWSSRIAVLVAGPAILGILIVALLVVAHGDFQLYIDALVPAGGRATFQPGFWLAGAGSVALAAAGTLTTWRARHRVALQFLPGSRWIAGSLGGVAGAIGGFIVGARIASMAASGANAGAASSATVLLGLLLAFVGAWLGATVGASLFRPRLKP